MAVAKKDDNPFVNLSGETMLEVVFINGERIMVTNMSYREFYYLKPNPEWKKRSYQIGRCAFKATEIFDKNKII